VTDRGLAVHTAARTASSVGTKPLLDITVDAVTMDTVAMDISHSFVVLTKQQTVADSRLAYMVVGTCEAD